MVFAGNFPAPCHFHVDRCHFVYEEFWRLVDWQSVVFCDRQFRIPDDYQFRRGNWLAWFCPLSTANRDYESAGRQYCPRCNLGDMALASISESRTIKFSINPFPAFSFRALDHILCPIQQHTGKSPHCSDPACQHGHCAEIYANCEFLCDIVVIHCHSYLDFRFDFVFYDEE